MRWRSSLPATLVLAIAAATGASGQFVSGFEAEAGYVASPDGTPLSGQVGFYMPTTPSADARCYTYADNALGAPPNPVGGDQFIALTRTAQRFARTQRDFPFSEFCWTVQLDINLMHVGTMPAGNPAASISLQPFPDDGSLAILLYWDNPLAPGTYTLRVLGGDADGRTQFAGGLPVANPAFQGLLSAHWYRLSFRVEYATRRLASISIRDLQTGSPRVTFAPEDYDGYFVGGGTGSSTLPTALRLFAGGGFENDYAAGNTLAVDNLGVQPMATDCAGDVNDDGAVNLVDLAILLSHFGSEFAVHSDGDLQCNGVVDLPDLATLLANFGTVCGDS